MNLSYPYDIQQGASMSIQEKEQLLTLVESYGIRMQMAGWWDGRVDISGEMAIDKREEHKKSANIAFDKIKEHLKKCSL
jgi:hypothetical protein